MANKLPNETELFSQLNNEKVVISSELWSIIYKSIEDSILVIKLIITFYREQNKHVTVDESKKILKHIQEVSSLFRKLLKPQIIKTEDKGLIKIKSETENLHPIIREMFSHYIGNDIQALNFIIGDYIDDGKDLDEAMSTKIMGHVTGMEEFLLKLKANTETTEERIKNELTAPLVYLRSLRESLDTNGQEKIDKCIASLETINKLIKKDANG